MVAMPDARGVPNYPGQPSPGYLQNLKAGQDRKLLEYRYRFSRDIQASFDAAVRSGIRGWHKRVAKLAAAMAAAGPREQADMRRTNERLARVMREAAYQDFTRKVGRHRKGSYRVGRGRISGGALKRALNSKSMAVGFANRIEYVDQDLLNKTAKHWARLNFGAGAAGRRTNVQKMYKLRFGGRGARGATKAPTIIKVGFRTGPRPAFYMPIGMWREEGGGRVPFGASRGDMFFPTSSRFWAKPTRGIAAMNFLNAGFKALEDEFPRAYQDLYDGWLARNKRMREVIRQSYPVKGRGGKLLT